MPIDPSIPLQLKTFETPNLLLSYMRGQKAGRLRDEHEALQERRAAVKQLAPEALSGNENALMKLSGIAPAAAQKVSGIVQKRNAQQDQYEAVATLKAQQLFQNGDMEGAVRVVSQLPPSQAKQHAMQAIQSGNTDAFGQMLDMAVTMAERQGLIKSEDVPAWQQKFDAYQNDPAYRDYVAQTGSDGTNVTVNMPSQTPFGKELGQTAAKKFLDERGKAMKAAQALRVINESRQILNSDVITGFGADWIVGVGKALKQAGFDVGNGALANTEAFAANQAKVTMGLLQNLGSGSGLSDADREFAAKAAGGNINMTESAIKRLLQIQEQAARETIERYNQRAQKIPQNITPFPLTIQTPESAGQNAIESLTPEQAPTQPYENTTNVVQWSELE